MVLLGILRNSLSHDSLMIRINHAILRTSRMNEKFQ